MVSNNIDEVELQRNYYAETACRYNEMHVDGEDDEHNFALSFMESALNYLGVKSILDIGSGTGRTLLYLKDKRPDIRIVGIEPVKELREIGYKNGIAPTDLVGGDALNLQYKNGEFDLVCEFGVLHHIRRPEIVVSEMLRVAKKAIFLSDSNNFGQGSAIARNVKQIINLLGLWRAADFIKTKGKGYTISEGDGLGYSYSVFDNYELIRQQCKSIHLLNTKDGQINPYKTASHVALLGIKRS
ncbi:methyltransferase type 11 [Sulfuricella denitrificans skB26]|uniref:Methyltransferase type 11 n=1 Tax=Sulfuricella denitrificans (strain DSM 22764 / NBRC 105220 / skB26) TaxID=1163617 RepID=S6AKQ2_SULDS|nr:class I SAM-dependent methyltransferase [Sulfuricella denitrificans]BAN35169.1 methyltransferase type 11 [Sulfuricella denitrificans skB26]